MELTSVSLISLYSLVHGSRPGRGGRETDLCAFRESEGRKRGKERKKEIPRTIIRTSRVRKSKMETKNVRTAIGTSQKTTRWAGHQIDVATGQ
jgi:hypothetical protein